MSAYEIVFATRAAETATALIPLAVPASWTGSASQACTLQLEELQVLASGLSEKEDAAWEAALALDSLT